ncbi:unnamed protein product [Durusdinium trenchii]|uniref:Acyltransferase 3 domain-containing protein n=1 Tax=Durusdinium trenchii TaxID=1381693 RepID=A0ABP0QRN6_9DINO
MGQMEPPLENKVQQDRMPHFDGARTLFAMWIVCHHMAPREPTSCLDAMLVRVDVGVEFFILLSGFLTHHLYMGQDISATCGSLFAYFVRRVFRCLLATYVGMVLCALTQWSGTITDANKFSRAMTDTDTCFFLESSCFLLSKTWVDPTPNCPNMPSWFVVSLLPCWFLYPWMKFLPQAGSSAKHCMCLAFTLWCLAIGPQLCILFWQRSWLKWNQLIFTWFWPPALMPDFMLGCCIASIVHHNPPRAEVGWIGDIAIVVLVCACMVVPVPTTPEDWAGPDQWRPGHYVAWEQLFARLSAPFLCTFLYCTASQSGGSLTASLLSHKTLVSLGRYTLEVYLLQMPLHDFFLWTRAPGAQGLWQGLPWTPEVFWFYLLLLWVSCVMFVEFLAEPLNRKIKDRSLNWVGKSLSQLCMLEHQQL